MNREVLNKNISDIKTDFKGKNNILVTHLKITIDVETAQEENLG